MTRQDWINELNVWETELVAVFGASADAVRYTHLGRGEDGSALRAAWLRRVEADRAYHAQFAAA